MFDLSLRLKAAYTANNLLQTSFLEIFVDILGASRHQEWFFGFILVVSQQKYIIYWRNQTQIRVAAYYFNLLWVGTWFKIPATSRN